MQTNNKTLVVTLASVLIAAFFMPWITYIAGLSAWNLIFGQASALINTDIKYLAILIPLSGVLIIHGAVFNNEIYSIPKKLLFQIPNITLAIIIIGIAFKVEENGNRVEKLDFERIFKLLGIGFWLTVIASTILPNVKSGPKS